MRLVHWALALVCVAAWITSDFFLRWHEPFGYAALALVVARIAWGIIGSPYARLAQFVRGPGATRHYFREVLRGHAARYLGHNPLGAWMALALWQCVAALGLTGWLMNTDMFWGVEWLDWLHHALAWLLIALVVAHVAGVVTTGRRHRENLVLSMWTGRKRAPGPHDVA